MFSRNRDSTRVERHSNHRNMVALRTASSLVFYFKESPTRSEDQAGDVNISGVDFWHAVEFSRNGRFLRAAFQQTLRALRSFVFQAYQMFSAPFPARTSFRLALGVSNLTRSSAPLRPQEAFAVPDLTARPTS
jgi:hypothetical protein